MVAVLVKLGSMPELFQAGRMTYTVSLNPIVLHGQTGLAVEAIRLWCPAGHHVDMIVLNGETALAVKQGIKRLDKTCPERATHLSPYCCYD